MTANGSPKQEGSALIRQFASHRSTVDWVPAEWAPKHLYGLPVWTLGDNYFRTHVVIRLDNIDFEEERSRDEDNRDLMIEKLSSWILKFPDIGLAGQMGGFSPATGHWCYTYYIGDYIGTFNVWIIPTGGKSATLIAEIEERHIPGISADLIDA